MNSLNFNNPLVSVVVITYNSAKTVRETLDSVMAQTYQNIELIISDDCSKDDTVQVCRDWLADNESRFFHTKLITVENNTGTCANCNRGVRNSRGEWYKLIAGDDILFFNSIELFVNYFSLHPETDILFSNVKCFGNEAGNNNWPYAVPKRYFQNMTKEELYLALLNNNFLPASSAIIRKTCWEDLGGYDESMDLIEDWPFWIKAFKAHKKINYLNEYCAWYRLTGVTSSQNIESFSPRYQECGKKVSSLAQKEIANYSIGGKIYYYTTFRIDCNTLFGKAIHSINLFNPFRKKFVTAVNKMLNLRNL